MSKNSKFTIDRTMSLFCLVSASLVILHGTAFASLTKPAKPTVGKKNAAAPAVTKTELTNDGVANSDAIPASNDVETAAQVKFKAGKDLNFEEMLILGRLKRPEISVVTGDAGSGTDGLLKLRENFLDRMSIDAGEEVSNDQGQ
jgi:hypothetical protein